MRRLSRKGFTRQIHNSRSGPIAFFRIRRRPIDRITTKSIQSEPHSGSPHTRIAHMEYGDACGLNFSLSTCSPIYFYFTKVNFRVSEMILSKTRLCLYVAFSMRRSSGLETTDMSFAITCV